MSQPSHEPVPSSTKRPSSSRVTLVTAVVAVVAVVALSIPCCGVTASIAIPAFIGYLTRAKTAEASANLRNLHVLAEGYYTASHHGPDGVARTHCVVSSGRTPNMPGPGKTLLPSSLGPAFDELGFSAADPVYYQYEIVSVGGCGHGPDEALYTFRARGDLDGDGTESLYEIAAGTGPDGDGLQAPPRIYRENELE